MMYFESVDGQFIFTDEMRVATGKRIKKLRESRNLSLNEVSDVIGYKSKATLCKIENGEGALDIRILYGLGQLFEVPLSHLVYGTSFDFPELVGEDHLDEENTKKILFLDELSFDLGLLDDDSLRIIRKQVDEMLGCK